jgi:hypothetical protein
MNVYVVHVCMNVYVGMYVSMYVRICMYLPLNCSLIYAGRIDTK